MSNSGVSQKPKTGSAPQIIVLDKAYKLAEQWVDDMSKSAEDEPRNVESEGRPARLGLGAKVGRQSEVRPSNDPVERKLHAKLQAGRRKERDDEDASKRRKERDDEDDDSDGEIESRTSAFVKKRPGPPAPFTSTSVYKKQKR